MRSTKMGRSITPGTARNFKTFR